MKLTKSKLNQMIKETLRGFRTDPVADAEVTWDDGGGSIRLHGDKVFVDDGGGPSVIPLASLMEFVEKLGGRGLEEGKPDKGQKKSTEEWGKARKGDDKSRAQGKKASREREKEERGKRSEAKLEE